MLYSRRQDSTQHLQEESSESTRQDEMITPQLGWRGRMKHFTWASKEVQALGSHEINVFCRHGTPFPWLLEE